MEWIDAHCHLSDPSAVLRARAAGVKRVFLGGVDPADWERQTTLKKGHPDLIRTSFGLHPWEVDRREPREIEDALAVLASRLGEADAIGETGLDFHPSRDPERFGLQEEVFEAQIRMAISSGKPMVLHVVRGHERARARIRNSGFQGPFFLHRFSGSIEEAREWMRLGAFLSFNGDFLVPGKYEKVKRVIREIPLERLLLETDGVNEPACIREIYEGFCSLRGLDLEFLTQKLDENFRNFG